MTKQGFQKSANSADYFRLIELIRNTQLCGRSRRELQQLISERPLGRDVSRL